MAGVNRVVLIGHATRDAKVAYTGGGTAVAEFALAINSREKVGEEWQDRVDFFDVVVYGAQAESAGQYLTKGRLVGVDGRLRQERWETKDDPPAKRSKIRVVASSVEYLDKKGGGGSAEPRPEQAAEPAADFSGGGSDDDIPF